MICNSVTSKVSRFLGISRLILQKKDTKPWPPKTGQGRFSTWYWFSRMPMYTQNTAPQKMSFPWLIHAWNLKHLFINGCFDWMIPNHYIKKCCFTKHPLKNGCLGYQVYVFKWPLTLYEIIQEGHPNIQKNMPGILRKSHQIPWIFMTSPWFRERIFWRKQKKTSPLEIASPPTSQSCAAAKYHSHGCHEAWSTGTVFMQQFFDVSSVQSFNVYSGSDQLTETVSTYWGFRKWQYPTTMGFPTKNDHFGVFWGYHHFRKHPYNSGPKTKTTCLPPESHDAWKIMIVYFRNGPFFQGTS